MHAATLSRAELRRVSILMPAHNEEESLRWLLPRLIQTLATLDLPWETIVVDDGSTDQTAQIAAQYGLRVVKNPLRQGKGASIRQGLSYASGDCVVTMDADGSNVPGDLPSLIKPIMKGNADVIVGSRFKQQLAGSDQEPFIRRLGNAFFNLVIFLSTGFPITDSQSGYRAFSKQVLVSVPTYTNGFEWETEVLLKVVKRGYWVVEVPIHYKERVAGVSRLSLLSDSIKFLTLIIRDRLNMLS
jgi:glycosyltransferase involved in cell wall biosynthesis